MEDIKLDENNLFIADEVDRTSGPSVLCSKTKYFFANEEVSLTCKVQTSNSQIKAGQMEVVWKKVSLLPLQMNDILLCKHVT